MMSAPGKRAHRQMLRYERSFLSQDGRIDAVSRVFSPGERQVRQRVASDRLAYLDGRAAESVWAREELRHAAEDIRLLSGLRVPPSGDRKLTAWLWSRGLQPGPGGSPGRCHILATDYKTTGGRRPGPKDRQCITFSTDPAWEQLFRGAERQGSPLHGPLPLRTTARIPQTVLEYRAELDAQEQRPTRPPTVVHGGSLFSPREDGEPVEVEHRHFGRGLVMNVGPTWLGVEFYRDGGQRCRLFHETAAAECLDLPQPEHEAGRTEWFVGLPVWAQPEATGEIEDAPEAPATGGPGPYHEELLAIMEADALAIEEGHWNDDRPARAERTARLAAGEVLRLRGVAEGLRAMWAPPRPREVGDDIVDPLWGSGRIVAVRSWAYRPGPGVRRTLLARFDARFTYERLQPQIVDLGAA